MPNLLWLLVIVFVILALVGMPGIGPSWGSHSYGYYPSGLLGIIVIIVVILLLTGRL